MVRHLRAASSRGLFVFVLAACPAGLLLAQSAVAETVAQLVDAGKFAQAEAKISAALAEPDVSDADRQALAFERERMRRIRLDFRLDQAGGDRAGQGSDSRPQVRGVRTPGTKPA